MKWSLFRELPIEMCYLADGVEIARVSHSVDVFNKHQVDFLLSVSVVGNNIKELKFLGRLYRCQRFPSLQHVFFPVDISGWCAVQYCQQRVTRVSPSALHVAKSTVHSIYVLRQALHMVHLVEGRNVYNGFSALIA